MSRRIGLLAGAGVLPRLVAEGMRDRNLQPVILPFRGIADPDLRTLAEEWRPVGAMQLGSWIRQLRRGQCDQVVMVGKVDRAKLAHNPLAQLRERPDWRALRLWYRDLRRDRRTGNLVRALAQELSNAGIELMDSTTHISEHLAPQGLLAGPQVDAHTERQLAFGGPLVQSLADSDVGQSLAVLGSDVLAVEAIEGTDAMIDRAGALAKGRSWTLFKTSATNHDRRGDVPVIGPQTIARVAQNGGKTVAIGAGRVILLEAEKVRSEAERLGIRLLGF